MRAWCPDMGDGAGSLKWGLSLSGLVPRIPRSFCWSFPWELEEVCVCAMLNRCSHVRLFVTPWTIACQTPLSIGFSRQNTEVGCHALLQGIFPIQGSNPGILQVNSLLSEPPGKPRPCQLISHSSQTTWLHLGLQLTLDFCILLVLSPVNSMS